MNCTLISERLYDTQGQIIRLKRRAKAEWGARSNWPPFIRAKYESLKDLARECRAQLGERAAA